MPPPRSGRRRCRRSSTRSRTTPPITFVGPDATTAGRTASRSASRSPRPPSSACPTRRRRTGSSGSTRTTRRPTRSWRRPSPAPTSCSSSPSTRPYAHRPCCRALTDDPAAKTADAVKLLDTPGQGTAYDFAFHPKFAENDYLYVGWNGDFAGGKRKKKACRITRYTMNAGPAATPSTRSRRRRSSSGSRTGTTAAAVCFGTDGMLYVTSGDGTSDSDADEMGQRTDTAPRQGAAHRRRSPGRRQGVLGPEGQPVRRRHAVRPGDVGLRPAQPVADHLRREDRPHLGRAERPGPVGAGVPRPEGRQLRLERDRGEPPVLPEPQGRPDADRQADRRAPRTPSSARSPAASSTTASSSRSWTGAYIYGDYSTGRIWAMKHDGTKPVWHKELADPADPDHRLRPRTPAANC